MAPDPSVPRGDTTGRRLLHETWQPLTLLVVTLGFTAGFYSNLKSSEYTNEVVCDASGNIRRAYLDYNPLWDVSEFFSINMGFGGHLSYTQAKMIDACWDVLFGRGGQMIVGLTAYRVIRQSITLIMEQEAIPITTATTVCCQPQIHIMFAWELLKAAMTRSATRYPSSTSAKFSQTARKIACVSACIYVLSFATIAAVMTGYRTEMKGFFGDLVAEDKLTSIDDFHRARIVLQNGTQVGLPKDSYQLKGTTDESQEDQSLYSVLKECQ